MRDQSIVVTPESDPGATSRRNPATGEPRPPPADGSIVISPRARAAWGPLRDVARATPGAIIVGLDGTTLRIRDDGGADEVSAVPRRWSISADPTACGSPG